MESIKYGERQEQSSSQLLLVVNLQLSSSMLLKTEMFWGGDSNKESFKECKRSFLKKNHRKIE